MPIIGMISEMAISGMIKMRILLAILQMCTHLSCYAPLRQELEHLEALSLQTNKPIVSIVSRIEKHRRRRRKEGENGWETTQTVFEAIHLTATEAKVATAYLGTTDVLIYGSIQTFVCEVTHAVLQIIQDTGFKVNRQGAISAARSKILRNYFRSTWLNTRCPVGGSDWKIAGSH